MRVAPTNVAGSGDCRGSAGKFAPKAVNIGTKKRPGSCENLENCDETAFFGCSYFALERRVVAVADKWQSICSFQILSIYFPVSADSVLIVAVIESVCF